MVKVIFVTFACLLLALIWANQPVKAADQDLIRSGTIEFSTMSALIGANLIGPGIGYYKAEDVSELRMSFDVGYFITAYTELEGALGLIRTSFLDESLTVSMFSGKFSLNLPIPQSPVIPYAMFGVGLVNSENDSEGLYEIGGGLRLPMKVVKNLMARIEYSYNKSTGENSEGFHTVSLGFSVLFNISRK